MSAEPSARRLVLVSGWAPPTPGGTSLILQRLLGDSGLELDVWTRVTLWWAVRRGVLVLPARHRWFPKLRSIPRGPAAPSWPIAVANAVLAMASGRVIGRAARREGASWILSVVDEGFSQIAGAVAARTAGLPHVIWVLDPWEENAYSAGDRGMARRLERRLWRSAAAIVVHSEELSERYTRKHGVRCRVLPIPIEEHRPGPVDSRAEGPWEVLVAGSIYWAQADALERVARAVHAVPGASLTVVGDPRRCRPIGADRHEPELAPGALRARLAGARLLVLGLSFDSPHPEVVRTAAPARLPEYLASGVPLLVHAPAGSHVAELARRRDLGTVVDTPDVAALVKAIRAARDEPAAGARRAARAQEFAFTVHGVSAVRAEFTELLESLVADGG